MHDVPLPGMPAPPPRARIEPRDGERVARYNAKTRRLCDACTRLIHQYGQAAAPYPKSARWMVIRAERNWYLCYDHKDTRL